MRGAPEYPGSVNHHLVIEKQGGRNGDDAHTSPKDVEVDVVQAGVIIGLRHGPGKGPWRAGGAGCRRDRVGIGLRGDAAQGGTRD